MVLLCVLAVLLFQDTLVNRFIKPRITKAFADAYPAYSLRIADMNYNILKNRLGFDSVALSAVDGTFSSTMGRVSVSGIGWLHMIWSGTAKSRDFADAMAESQDAVLNLSQSHSTLHFERLHVSVPDSEIVIDSMKFHPSGDDEQFFGESKSRSTRFRAHVPMVRVRGIACLKMLEEKVYSARSVAIRDASIDVLVNKDKPNNREAASPLMLNEMLTSVKETLRIDSLIILDGRVKYSERFEVGAKPAWITFDHIRMVTVGIVNRGTRGAALYVQAQWNLANAGTMKLLMSIPIVSPGCSLQYTGSLSAMNLSAFNSFLEVSDRMRIKTGVLESVSFDVNIVSGRASGTVRGIYKDLSIAAIDKYTRSEKGFSNGVASWIANTFKINRNNIPDKSGSIRLGKVNYRRTQEDSFVNVVWFSLRTGVQDVGGF